MQGVQLMDDIYYVLTFFFFLIVLIGVAAIDGYYDYAKTQAELESIKKKESRYEEGENK